MTPPSRADPAARWLSHLLVGLAAGALVGRKAGPTGFVLAALLTGFAHEALDAPMAGVLAELGL